MYAKVAQVVEHHLAKVRVAGSSLVLRSRRSFYKLLFYFQAPGWWNGRHAGLKILWPSRLCGFESRPGYSKTVRYRTVFSFYFIARFTKIPQSSSYGIISHSAIKCLRSLSSCISGQFAFCILLASNPDFSDFNSRLRNK